MMKKYMLLLVDRKKARIFALKDNIVIEKKTLRDDYVPQKVKHGDDTWDAQDKIFRHIEDHLHRHLSHVANEAEEFTKKHPIDAIIIGSHKPLFGKIKKHLHYPLAQMVQGEFVTELKSPVNEILRRAASLIRQIEIGEVEKQKT